MDKTRVDTIIDKIKKAGTLITPFWHFITLKIICSSLYFAT